MLKTKMTASTILLYVFCTLLFLVNAACESTSSTNTTTTRKSTSTTNTASTTSTTTTVGATSSSSSPATMKQTIQTMTACPGSGVGRPAIMPQLSTATDHQNIVFFTNTASTGALERYDTLTKTTTAITTLTAPVETAQLSHDGHWILFTTGGQSTSTRLQLIRIDGKVLQTLYCSPAGRLIDPSNTTGVQWSPDEKQILFAQQSTKSTLTDIDLLQLSGGPIRTLLSATQYQPKTWVDDQRVYVTAVYGSSLYILDTTKQAGQDLQLVIGVEDTRWSFDSDYNTTTLFVTYYDDTVGRAGPGTYCEITAGPVNGGNARVFFKKNDIVVSDLRVAGYSSTTLLLRVNERAPALDQNNGIWSIQKDGTGLKRLTNVPGPFNAFTQYPWSNVSHDGAYYLDYQGYGLLSGGPLTTYTSTGIPIGWAVL